MCCRAFSTITNMNFDKGPLLAMLQRVMDERKKIASTWEISLAQPVCVFEPDCCEDSLMEQAKITATTAFAPSLSAA